MRLRPPFPSVRRRSRRVNIGSIRRESRSDIIHPSIPVAILHHCVTKRVVPRARSIRNVTTTTIQHRHRHRRLFRVVMRARHRIHRTPGLWWCVIDGLIARPTRGPVVRGHREGCVSMRDASNFKALVLPRSSSSPPHCGAGWRTARRTRARTRARNALIARELRSTREPSVRRFVDARSVRRFRLIHLNKWRLVDTKRCERLDAGLV